MNIDYTAYLFKAKSLLIVASLPTKTIKEKIIQAYTRQVAKQIHDLIDSMGSARDPDNLSTLISYFAGHWERIHSSTLSYTALANTAITRLLCEIAADVATASGKPILEILMPTLNTTSYSNAFEDLMPANDANSMIRLLNTHITGREGRYLIPIKLIDKIINAQALDQAKPYNVYFDFETHDEAWALLDENELSRLYRHSTVAETLIDTKRHYDMLAHNDCSLWGQLCLLVKQLTLNSVEGFGSETVAGQGGNIAIGQFLYWYDQLGAKDKSQLPEALLSEIDKLERCYNFVDDKGEPRISLIDTCLSTRKTALKKAMKGHEKLLTSIGLSSDKHTQQIRQAKKNLDFSRVQFNTSLANPNYSGHDNLGISPQLLDALKVEFTLSNYQELSDLVTSLDEPELLAFCDNEYTREEMQARLDNLENLVILLTQVSVQKLTILVTSMQQHIKLTLIPTTADYAATLISLSDEKTQAFITAFDPTFSTIDLAQDLVQLLENLNDTQKSMVSDACIVRIFQQTQSTVYLKRLFAALTVDQREAAFDTNLDHIVQCINDGEDFIRILEHLTTSQRSTLYRRCFDKLLQSIQSGWYLGAILQYLRHQERQDFLIACRDSGRRFLGIGQDISYCMEHLLDRKEPLERIILKHVREIFFNPDEKCFSLAIAITNIRLEGTPIIKALQDNQSALYKSLNTRGLSHSFSFFGPKHWVSQQSHVLQELELQMEKVQQQEHTL